jgi:hypothetical protein
MLTAEAFRNAQADRSTDERSTRVLTEEPGLELRGEGEGKREAARCEPEAVAGADWRSKSIQ